MPYFASTERLHLREQRESDADRLFDLMNDPSVQRTGPGYVVPQGSKMRQGIADIGEKTLFFALIEVKDDQLEKAPEGEEGTGSAEEEKKKKREGEKFVGFVSLAMTFPKNRDAQLGIALVDKWRGKGYGTEVMKWLVDYAFEELALHRISLGVLEGNVPAIKLYKSVGFVEEVRKRKSNWQDGRWWDMIDMGLLDEDWAKEKAERSS